MREQAAILDDVTDATPKLGNVRRGDGRAVEADRAGVRIEEPNDEAEVLPRGKSRSMGWRATALP
jgi:hypothetical protein